MLARAKQLARRRGAAVGGCGMIFSEVRLHIVWTPLTGDHARGGTVRCEVKKNSLIFSAESSPAAPQARFFAQCCLLELLSSRLLRSTQGEGEPEPGIVCSGAPTSIPSPCADAAAHARTRCACAIERARVRTRARSAGAAHLSAGHARGSCTGRAAVQVQRARVMSSTCAPFACGCRCAGAAGARPAAWTASASR